MKFGSCITVAAGLRDICKVRGWLICQKLFKESRGAFSRREFAPKVGVLSRGATESHNRFRVVGV